jgi:peptidoglycan/LPS O-acetylase OafA/YrhL
MTGILTYDAYRLRNRMPALDGVRALAILGVLFHHTRNAPFARLHGFRGVWIFFVLSGFLITTLALREEAKTGRLSVRAFAIRRVLRIMPLYYLALVAYVLWACVFHMEENGDLLQRYLPNFILYCSEFPIFQHHFKIPFGQTWSLGIEEKFYLAWPLLAFWWLARSRHRVKFTLALLLVTATLTATSGVLAQMWGSYTDILLGCLLGLLLHDRNAYRYLAVVGRSGIAWAILAALALTTLSSITGTQLGERLFSLLGAAAIAALVTNEGSPAAALSAPWLVRIGWWSYAIYLTHPLVIDAVGPLMPAGRVGDFLSLAAMLAIDLPLCWLVHIYIERPLIDLGRRWAARPTSHAANVVV